MILIRNPVRESHAARAADHNVVAVQQGPARKFFEGLMEELLPIPCLRTRDRLGFGNETEGCLDATFLLHRARQPRTLPWSAAATGS